MQQLSTAALPVIPHLFPNGISDTMMSTDPVRKGRLQISHWMMSKGMPGEALLQVQKWLSQTWFMKSTFRLRRSIMWAKRTNGKIQTGQSNA